MKKEEFLNFRETRDKELAIPKLLYPSIQVNMRAGHLPAPEANGVAFFMTPISAAWMADSSSH